MSVVAGLWIAVAPVSSHAGNVGWAVSVGASNAWSPAAYGSGWGNGWGNRWGNPWGSWSTSYSYSAPYYAPQVVYVEQQPLVLAAQAQPPVWYYCVASGKYFPYEQNCPSGWETRPAMPPSSTNK